MSWWVVRPRRSSRQTTNVSSRRRWERASASPGRLLRAPEDPILEDASAPELLQRIDLEVELLVLGRDPSVADEVPRHEGLQRKASDAASCAGTHIGRLMINTLIMQQLFCDSPCA